jgi:hypothetical protein
MMGILAQALNEDGLPGSGEIGYALPYYSFNHEDNIKYYIKNEDESRGLYSSYLVETSAHQLEWHTMTAEEAAADDHAAWYLSFTPNNQYYQIKNAATGYYMTYSNGFRTASHSKPTTADNIHLMRGRVDVKGHRGYYFIHPEQTSNPPVMIANTNGKTASSSFNISTKATTQRWLILNADEAAVMEGIKAGRIKKYVTDFPNSLTAGKPGVIATPHLGASTAESEENCAEMAVKEIIDYLENGNIIHSVNYPDCDMGICGTEGRLAILHQNSKGMIAQYTAILGDAGINISDMTNKGKGDFAYSLVDYEGKLSPDTVKALEEIPEVYKVRVIKG